MSPRIRSEVAKGIEPKERQDYKILSVEATKTQAQGFPAYRLKMESTREDDENEYTTMLWDSDIVGRESKLGSFMWAFMQYFDNEDDAYNTDKWLGHIVRVLSWNDKKREIMVISSP